MITFCLAVCLAV